MAPSRRRDAPAGYPPVLKRLGQHFLSDPRILDRIADALALDGHETVVEIGPGRGGLTDRVIPRAGRVVVIELDRALAALLREKYAAESKVEVIEGDALTISLASAAHGLVRGPDTGAEPDAPPATNASARADAVADHVVVGNVPYYITTPLLFHALARPRPSRAVFLVQREVAERIVAPAGADSYGALSANVQAVADARILFRVPPGAFQPPPKVDSAVIQITPRAGPVVTAEEEDPFRKLVQGAFGFRRKQMRKVVRSLTGLSAHDADRVLAGAGVDPEVRPETLDAARFAAILRELRALGAEPADAPVDISPER
jgi:16S rRNA (adenine1518-N6/adenine1519-N6)-dimethyltransferase